MATPNAAPSWRIVEKAPEALPISASGVVAVADLVSEGIATARPTPEMTRGTASAR
jgi:hypothetical protein